MFRASLLILSVALLANGASAQQVISDPAAIGACLCLRQELDTRNAAVASARQALEQAQAEATRLSQEVERRKPQVQVDDAADVAAFTDLLHQSEVATSRVGVQRVPAYNAAVDAYNKSSLAYSQQCGGKSYDSAALQRAQSNLVCPKP